MDNNYKKVTVKLFFEAWAIVEKFRIYFIRYNLIFRAFLILIFSYLIASFISEHFSFIQYLEYAGTFFTATGAMLGGIIAIVFSLSLFSQQSASELFSSRYYNMYSYNFKEILIFTLFVILTMVHLGLGAYYNFSTEPYFINNHQIVVFIAFLSLGSAFSLLDWQFQIIRTKSNPLNIIGYVKKKALNEINKINSMLKVLFFAYSQGKSKKTKAIAYNSIFEKSFNDLDNHIGSIHEISSRMAARYEVINTIKCYDAIIDILFLYLDTRNKNALILPEFKGLLIFKSDCQRFLVNTFERVDKDSKQYISSGQTQLTLNLINFYERIAVKLSTFEYVENPIQINPLLGITFRYLKNIIDAGISKQDLDIAHNASIALDNISESATSDSTVLHLIQDELYDLALYAHISGYTFILDQCIKTSNKILLFPFYKKTTDGLITISNSLKFLENIFILTHSTEKIPSYFKTSDSSVIKPQTFGSIPLIVHTFLTIYQKQEDKQFAIQDLILIFFQTLYRNIRNIAENAEYKKISAVDFNEFEKCIGICIDTLIYLIANTDSNHLKDKLESDLYGYLHLPHWIVSSKSKTCDSLYYSNFIDLIPRTCLKLFDKNELHLRREFISSGIRTYFLIIKEAINNNEYVYHFEAARFMIPLCIIGALALKRKRREILTNIGLIIFEFEDLYTTSFIDSLPEKIKNSKATNLPTPKDLMWELIKWRDDYAQGKHDRYSFALQSNTTCVIALESITIEDIDWFILEVWGVIPEYSPVSDKLEKENKKLIIAYLIHMIELITNKKKTPS